MGPKAPSLVLAHTLHDLEVLGEGTHKQEQDYAHLTD